MMQRWRLREYLITRADDGRLAWARRGENGESFEGTASVSDGVLYLSDWKSRNRYRGELDDIPELSEWEETPFYARATHRGWTGVRRCDSGDVDNEKSAEVMRALRRAQDRVVFELTRGEVADLRSRIEIQEIDDAIVALRACHRSDGSEFPETSFRLLHLCRRAIKAEGTLEDDDWDEFARLRERFQNADGEAREELLNEYGRRAAFWLRLLDTVEHDMEWSRSESSNA